METKEGAEKFAEKAIKAKDATEMGNQGMAIRGPNWRLTARPRKAGAS